MWRKDKQGFINPEGEWLKHELRPALEQFFAREMLTEQLGFVDREALMRRYRAFCAQPPRRGTYSVKDIFGPLVFEMWARTFESSLQSRN